MNLRSFFLVPLLVLAASSLVASDVASNQRYVWASQDLRSRVICESVADTSMFVFNPCVSTASGRLGSAPIDWAVSRLRGSHKSLLVAGDYKIAIFTFACTRTLPIDGDKVLPGVVAAYKKLSSTYQRLRAPLDIIFLSSGHNSCSERREDFIIIVTRLKLPSGVEKKAFHIFTSAGKDVGGLSPRDLVGALCGVILEDSGLAVIDLTSCMEEGPELDTFLAVLMSKQE